MSNRIPFPDRFSYNPYTTSLRQAWLAAMAAEGREPQDTGSHNAVAIDVDNRSGIPVSFTYEHDRGSSPELPARPSNHNPTKTVHPGENIGPIGDFLWPQLHVDIMALSDPGGDLVDVYIVCSGEYDKPLE